LEFTYHYNFFIEIKNLKAMKQIKKSAYFIVPLIFFVSCSEYLKPTPKSFFTQKNVYTNESGIESLLPTMRSNLMWEVTGWDNTMALQFMVSDLAITISPANLNNVTPNLDPGNPVKPFLETFKKAYVFIKNANTLLANIYNIKDINEQKRNELIAKAFWYRAYWYYLLVNDYGDVPWSGKLLSSPKVNYATYSRSAILERVQKDLEFAVKWLPDEISRNAEITKGAAQYLLIKVYLANYEFKKAINTANNLIENGPYSLMEHRFGVDKNDPKRNLQWDLHRWQNINSSENTETILATIDRPEAPKDAKVGTYLNRMYTPSWWKILGPKGFRLTDHTTPAGDTLGIGNSDVHPNNYYNYKIWNKESSKYNWENTPDQRRAAMNWVEMTDIIAYNPKSPWKGKPFTQKFYSDLADTFDTWFAWPQYKILVLNPLTGTAYGNISSLPVGPAADEYIFRLAGAYLLRAEAYYWKGDIGDAAHDINVIRKRAHAPLISTSDVTIGTIFDERARELYIETPRHAEMVRVSYIMAHLGRNGYSIDNFSKKNWFYDRVMKVNDIYQITDPIFRGEKAHINPYNVLFPIPESVIEANVKGHINQNVGYQGSANNVAPIDTVPAGAVEKKLNIQ
jgi:hypothetical protein